MEQMTFLYTALGVMDKTYHRYGKGWDEYVVWIKPFPCSVSSQTLIYMKKSVRTRTKV